MSTLLGLHIRQSLAASDVVSAKVGDKMYPEVVTQGVPDFPFIRYSTTVESADYCKGPKGLEHVSDNCAVTVDCVAKDYYTAVEIAEACRQALEAVEAEYDRFKVASATVDKVSCVFDDEIVAFDVQITMSMETQF